jgi:uncharacterized membrane protein YhiD involved in acid resistance
MHFFKYHFNPGTYLRYPTARQMARGIKFLLNAFFTAVMLAAVLIAVHDVAFETEKTKKMRAENSLLASHQPNLEKEVEEVERSLRHLLKIDKSLHTKLFDVAPGLGTSSSINKERVLLASAVDFRSLIQQIDARASALVQRSSSTNASFGA